MLLFVFVRLLLRFATRQLVAVLLQLPPRYTRFVPDDRRPELAEFLPFRRVGAAAKELVEPLLHVRLRVGYDLDEFGRHRPEIVSKIFQGFAPEPLWVDVY
jgi:hypothetical protein